MINLFLCTNEMNNIFWPNFISFYNQSNFFSSDGELYVNESRVEHLPTISQKCKHFKMSTIDIVVTALNNSVINQIKVVSKLITKLFTQQNWFNSNCGRPLSEVVIRLKKSNKLLDFRNRSQFSRWKKPFPKRKFPKRLCRWIFRHFCTDFWG